MTDVHPSTKLLNDARAEVTFPLEKMTKLLYGSEKLIQLLKKSQDLFDKSPIWNNDPDFFNQSRKEQILRSIPKFGELKKLINIDDIDEWIIAANYTNCVIPLVVYYGMVIPAVRILGSDEQVQRWNNDMIETKIVACYAQTELGHGSDVQNLETTATYDKATDQFIINTPSVSAAKFWPGELGLYSNWALTYAQLIIDGKSYGPHPFMVPIRDMETHQALPGITVGDIGPKLGYATKDNGFLAFDNVRISRDNLLQRFTKVSREGVYSKHGNEKVLYASMMVIRKMLCYLYPRAALQSLTIAVRYSICRQQFKNDQGQENSVLEYQAQQDKLLTRLAKGYGIIFGGLAIKQLAEDNFERIKRKDFSTFNETHAILSGGKSYYTYFVNETCEWTRLSCGGHGFAHYSGLPAQFFDNAPNVTLEGENQIMYLQLARFLLKVVNWSTKSPTRVPYHFAYIKDLKSLTTEVVQSQSEEEVSSPATLFRFLQQSAAVTLADTLQRLQVNVQNGLSMRDTWDRKIGIYLMQSAERYMDLHTFMMFEETLPKTQNEAVKSVIVTLQRLFGVDTLLNFTHPLVEGGLITSEQIKSLRLAKEKLLLAVKKEAIGLVDAFQFSDGALKTLIGCHDGRPYEKIFEWATTKNSMNLSHPSIAKAIENVKQYKDARPKL